MRIARLTFEHFRSFRSLNVECSEEPVHLFLGPNGAGKTNILEGISVLSLLRSFLASQEVDLIHWGEEYYRVRAQMQADDGTVGSVEVVSQLQPRKRKVCFVNDVQVPLLSGIGHLPTVAFLPQDLELSCGAPAVRRRFFDELLCQVSPLYAQTLTRYQKILKQRNTLLKRIGEGVSGEKDLAQWDALLSEQGAALLVPRLELAEICARALAEEVTNLGEVWKDVSLIYERRGTARTERDIAAEFKELLVHYRERDIILQSTSVGPHRHDWRVEVEGRPLSTFASRGQQRTVVIALLFLKVSYLELKRCEKPVILLDDVFSELDDLHQQALLKSFDAYQVFITSTHSPAVLHGAQVFAVGEGKVRSKTGGATLSTQKTSR